MDKITINAGNYNFWEKFYLGDIAPHEPTPFFHWLDKYLLNEKRNVIEFGCGNGRDSFGFVAAGHSIISLDASASAIDYCNKIKDKTLDSSLMGKIGFNQLNLKEITKLDNILLERNFTPNLIYSRFLFHAVTEDVQNILLQYSSNLLRKGDYMAHEFRTDKDPLMLKGEFISDTERLTDHYRRFINAEKMLKNIENCGFEIVYFKESNDFAVYKNDNPIVARIVAKKL